ncbi:MAG TPA: hypothetical protein ENL23_01610, partial [Candidatus Acetothermia bacterium]|nr:hypothetical protein [Candidatus Acetothermia bacterium]
MKSWTVNEMLAERPCKEYTREILTNLWAGRERLSLLDVLDLNIPNEDKLWAACRPNAFDEQPEWIVDDVVAHVVREYALPCEVTREWAKKWLSGEDRTKDAAEETARAAWAAEAPEAAKAAARAADAAWAVARGAGAAQAAKDAARAVLAAGEYKRQLDCVRKRLD